MGMPLPVMTLADYLDWEAQQPDRHEFYRGETFAMVGGTGGHHRVIVNLTRRIDEHLDGTACKLFSESMKLQVGDHACFYSDIMVTCGVKVRDVDKVVTQPVLIIEVLSPGTQGYDRLDKFSSYRLLPSLKEYVLIDPATRTVQVYNATDTGTGAWLFTDQSRLPAVTLASIGFELPLDWVFKGMEPDPA